MWSRIKAVGRTLHHHTFTLPLHAMTYPPGVCFSDGFGGLEYRVITVHELSFKHGRIMHMVVETKHGIFSSPPDIFKHVILDEPLVQTIGAKEVKSRKELYKRDPTEAILGHLLPCIKIGNAYVSDSDWERQEQLTLLHAVRPFHSMDSCTSFESILTSNHTIRTRFAFSTQMYFRDDDEKLKLVDDKMLEDLSLIHI